MGIFGYIVKFLPFIEEIIKAVEDAIAAGKASDVVHQQIADHLAELPAKIRTS